MHSYSRLHLPFLGVTCTVDVQPIPACDPCLHVVLLPCSPSMLVFFLAGCAGCLQPMLMPLLAEMPGGTGGVVVSERAVHFVLFGGCDEATHEGGQV